MDWLYIVAAVAIVLVAMFIWLMFFSGGGTVEMMGRHTDLRPTPRNSEPRKRRRITIQRR